MVQQAMREVSRGKTHVLMTIGADGLLRFFRVVMAESRDVERMAVDISESEGYTDPHQCFTSWVDSVSLPFVNCLL